MINELIDFTKITLSFLCICIEHTYLIKINHVFSNILWTKRENIGKDYLK